MAERPYAEVIGDPIGHSRSPALHGFWLRRAGVAAEYRATRVAAAELGMFLAERRRDPMWRGCNVTAPHKQAVIPLLDRIDPAAAAVGAVNCIVPDGDGLSGTNTDVEGIAAALAGVALRGRRVVLIGAGGAARAALHALRRHGPAEIALLARDPEKGEKLRHIAPDMITCAPLTAAASAVGGAALIINATPLGMRQAEPMPIAVLDALSSAAEGATAFDMVYDPLRTIFLERAAAAGLRPVDGLVMLIGQARRAFTLFFGAAPPTDDAALRAALLASPGPAT